MKKKNHSLVTKSRGKPLQKIEGNYDSKEGTKSKMGCSKSTEGRDGQVSTYLKQSFNMYWQFSTPIFLSNLI